MQANERVSLTVAPGDDQVFLTAAQVKRRYGFISDMTIWRWLNTVDSGFPAPMIVSGRRYWRKSELEEFERQNVVKHQLA